MVTFPGSVFHTVVHYLDHCCILFTFKLDIKKLYLFSDYSFSPHWLRIKEGQCPWKQPLKFNQVGSYDKYCLLAECFGTFQQRAHNKTLIKKFSAVKHILV